MAALKPGPLQKLKKTWQRMQARILELGMFPVLKKPIANFPGCTVRQKDYISHTHLLTIWLVCCCLWGYRLQFCHLQPPTNGLTDLGEWGARTVLYFLLPPHDYSTRLHQAAHLLYRSQFGINSHQCRTLCTVIRALPRFLLFQPLLLS